MRRRPKQHPAGGPPPELAAFRGRTVREALAWTRARSQWWDDNRDPDDAGWLPWLLDTWDQVDPLPWCGSVGALCGDDNCLCAAWEEHLAATS